MPLVDSCTRPMHTQTSHTHTDTVINSCLPLTFSAKLADGRQ